MRCTFRFVLSIVPCQMLTVSSYTLPLPYLQPTACISQALLLFCGNPSFKVAMFRQILSLMKGIGNAPDYLGYTTVHALLQVASPCSEHLEGLRHIVSGKESEGPSFYEGYEGKKGNEGDEGTVGTVDVAVSHARRERRDGGRPVSTTRGTTGGCVKGMNAKSKINEPTLRGFTPLMYVHSRPVHVHLIDSANIWYSWRYIVLKYIVHHSSYTVRPGE